MKILILLSILSLGVLVSKAQCPLTNCNDSVAYTVTSVPLAINAGYTVVQWKVVNGPGLVSGTTLTNLKPNTTTVLQLIAQDGSRTSISVKTVTVAQAPIVLRTLVGIAFVNGKWQVTYSDGVIQTF